LAKNQGFLPFFDVFGPFLTILRQKIAFLGPSSIIAEILEIQINSRREMINIAPPSRRFGVRRLDAAFTQIHRKSQNNPFFPIFIAHQKLLKNALKGAKNGEKRPQNVKKAPKTRIFLI